VDWASVMGVVWPRVRAMRSTASAWIEARREPWENAALGLPFHVLSAILIGGMIVTGIGRVQSWPISVYPPSSGPISPRRVILLDATALNGTAYHEVLSHDPVLQSTFSPERWKGMLHEAAWPGKPYSAARERAIVCLWEAAHHRFDIAAARIYVDTYDGSGAQALVMEHRLVGGVDMRAPADR
jgi:hypothetical protein